MKKLLLFLPVFLFGCDQAPPVQNANTAAVPPRNERSEMVIAHTAENQKPPMQDANVSATGTKTKWSQSGEPVDTKEFDANIVQAVKAMKAKPADATAKKTLGDAYFKRAVALTEARQYASALGDYRRALKNDPTNTEAKDWIDKILMIYDSMNKEAPKEGDEPPPFPYKKDEK